MKKKVIFIVLANGDWHVGVVVDCSVFNNQYLKQKKNK